MPTQSRATTAQATMTAAAAARSIAFFLDLEDTNRITLAVLMAASEELERNGQFVARVRAAYNTLPASKTRGAGSAGSAAQKAEEARKLAATLKPIHEVEGREINLAAPLDPYFLLDVYGAQQLRQALELFPLAKLKEGVNAVIERNPGTKPTSKSSKAAVIDYIERYVAGTAARQH